MHVIVVQFIVQISEVVDRLAQGLPQRLSNGVDGLAPLDEGVLV